MRGPEDIALHIQRVLKRNLSRTKEIVEEITEMVFEESQNTVPVDTGALKGSGRYEVFEEARIGDRTYYSGTIRYGGETSTGPTRNAPDGVVHYASIVHEIHKPFLLMAWDNVRTKAIRRIRRYTDNLATQLVKVPQ